MLNFDFLTDWHCLYDKSMYDIWKICWFISNCLFYVFFSDDIELPTGIDVYVKDMDCSDQIEKLYYSCGYQPICIYCAEYLHDADESLDTYPQCEDCSEPAIKKRWF